MAVSLRGNHALSATVKNEDISRMNLPFEVVKVRGADALAELESLERGRKGYPVILGDPEAVEHLQEGMSLSDKSVDELILLACDIDPEAWFGQRMANDPEYYTPPRGPWPEDVKPPAAIMGHLDIRTGKPRNEVLVGMIPVAESWKVPCVLKFGGWNECPFPQEHAAVLKRWNGKYGADVATVAGDILEMRVKRPPTSRAEALALAKEQFVYCSDIVLQGTETIDALAANLLNSPAWFFWWD
jgi:hypothetical protein